MQTTVHLVAWSKPMQCCHLLSHQWLTKQVDWWYLATEHCVNVHLMTTANETFVKRLKTQHNIWQYQLYWCLCYCMRPTYFSKSCNVSNVSNAPILYNRANLPHPPLHLTVGEMEPPFNTMFLGSQESHPNGASIHSCGRIIMIKQESESSCKQTLFWISNPRQISALDQHSSRNFSCW